jgi:hypothetical protein
LLCWISVYGPPVKVVSVFVRFSCAFSHPMQVLPINPKLTASRTRVNALVLFSALWVAEVIQAWWPKHIN